MSFKFIIVIMEKQKAMILKNPKHVCLAILMLILPGINVFHIRAEEAVNLEYRGNHGTHFVLPPTPADMPQVFIDNETGVITVDGPGYASYYYVDIISQSTLSVVLYDTVDGDYGTVDISSLPDDNYQIIITSSNNNEFIGQFTNY